MKINWVGGITKSLLFVFLVAVVGYEFVKLIKQRQNPLDALFHSDSLVFGFSIVIPLAIIAGLVGLGFYAVRGYTQPKFNWIAYLYQMSLVLIVAGIIIIGVFLISQEPVVRVIAIVTVLLGVIVSSDLIEGSIKNIHDNHDDGYDKK